MANGGHNKLLLRAFGRCKVLSVQMHSNYRGRGHTGHRFNRPYYVVSHTSKGDWWATQNDTRNETMTHKDTGTNALDGAIEDTRNDIADPEEHVVSIMLHEDTPQRRDYVARWYGTIKVPMPLILKNIYTRILSINISINMNRKTGAHDPFNVTIGYGQPFTKMWERVVSIEEQETLWLMTFHDGSIKRYKLHSRLHWWSKLDTDPGSYLKIAHFLVPAHRPLGSWRRCSYETGFLILLLVNLWDIVAVKDKKFPAYTIWCLFKRRRSKHLDWLHQNMAQVAYNWKMTNDKGKDRRTCMMHAKRLWKIALLLGRLPIISAMDKETRKNQIIGLLTSNCHLTKRSLNYSMGILSVTWGFCYNVSLHHGQKIV